MIERVIFDGVELALILRAGAVAPGIHFFTAPELSQQLAAMRHPSGHRIEPHVHNPLPRAVHITQEALFIRKGRLRVDFYNTAQAYLESRELGAGDVILLIAGGHGFEVLEDIDMVEVKQGPYMGEGEKTRFKSVAASEVRLHKGATQSL